MTPGSRRLVLGVLSALILLVAVLFGYMGCWLVLPFSGLEIGVLAWAFGNLDRQSGDYESLRICGDEVLVERRLDGQLEQRSFNRQWVQLLVTEKSEHGRVSVAVRSHGRETELGLFLSDEARLELAEALRARLRQGR